MDNLEPVTDNWYEIDNAAEVSSPSLLIYPDRIESNIRKLIEIAGNVERLRPHVKSHKMAEVVKLQMKYGITKFKSSTIAETEMVARCGASDIIFAMQPVGPNIERFFRLKKEFPGVNISCIADSEEIIIKLSEMARKTGLETGVWLDINSGMNRSGVAPGEKAVRLYDRIFDSPMLVAEGLHVYDGQIHDKDFDIRKKVCDESFSQVEYLTDELQRDVGPVKIVAGGTPTFTVHAMRKGVDLSPGTPLLWDWGYGSSFADMPFLNAAVLLMRIISKPAKETLCLDLGHKAIAAEMQPPRVNIFGIRRYKMSIHNEEHLVINTRDADNFRTGDVMYGIPWHICPTVDRHDTANVVVDHRVTGQWIIDARRRKITF
ncbi:MAG TPA: D-TA family PLP-dependent enzyme [Bacteroidales bacterium]|nr:D-TA family PLP-dependent enzyme [Bacteroidales bacterium]